VSKNQPQWVCYMKVSEMGRKNQKVKKNGHRNKRCCLKQGITDKHDDEETVVRASKKRKKGGQK